METKQELQARLALTRTELEQHIELLPQQRFQLRVQLESHIAACQHELASVRNKSVTAVLDECSMGRVLAAENAVERTLETIETCKRDIQDGERDLADPALWI